MICFKLLSVIVTVLGVTATDHLSLPSGKHISVPPQNVSYRLPNETYPDTYNIAISWIDEDNFTFEGEVTIVIIVRSNTNTIVVHKRQTDIKTVTIQGPGIPSPIALQFTYSDVTDFMTIPSPVVLTAPSKYTLKIAYSGVLRTDNRGFFRQSYVADTGETRWLAATHFEQNHARHGFPCYDEPQIKAKFTVSITHKSKYRAISNTNEIGSAPSLSDGDRKVTTFMETPVTSTYLIAFAITDFSCDQGRSESTDEYSKTLVRVFSRPHWIGDTNLTLHSGIAFIAEIGRYLGVPYSLQKIDQIAVPTFGGAMENWGLVVYTLV